MGERDRDRVVELHICQVGRQAIKRMDWKTDNWYALDWKTKQILRFKLSPLYLQLPPSSPLLKEPELDNISRRNFEGRLRAWKRDVRRALMHRE